MSEWILVEDNLPDEGVEVLCMWFGAASGEPQYIVDHVDNDGFVSDELCKHDATIPKITHWMPLPEPPK